MKKGKKKKKKNMSSLELPSDVVVGYSEAIYDDMKLEEIKSGDRIAHEHYTEV